MNKKKEIKNLKNNLTNNFNKYFKLKKLNKKNRRTLIYTNKGIELFLEDELLLQIFYQGKLKMKINLEELKGEQKWKI